MSDVPPPKTPADSAPTPAQRRPRWWVWAFWVFGGTVVIAGFCGVDRVFYENVSQRLNTEDNPYDRDFYTVSRPLWIVCRYTFAHIYGLLAIYFIVLATHKTGWRGANAALVGVAVAALAANVAQGAIGRLRPNQATSQWAFAKPLSTLLNKEEVCFPSGEAAAAFALACVLTRLWPRGGPAFYAAGTLTAAARLVNGAHYLSDVAAGAMVGVLIAGMVFAWAEKTHDRVIARHRRA